MYNKMKANNLKMKYANFRFPFLHLEYFIYSNLCKLTVFKHNWEVPGKDTWQGPDGKVWFARPLKVDLPLPLKVDLTPPNFSKKLK